MVRDGRLIVVTGATGRQGGATVRHLLRQGWQVRALSRKPTSKKAQALSDLGADMREADLSRRETLGPAFAGAYGVFSLQNGAISGYDEELRQARAVADAAASSGVEQVVYASAGPVGPSTGVRQWDLKREAESYMRGLGLALTVLRPNALMELMTDPGFYPAASTWHVMPKLAGGSTPIPWLCADDVGAIAALAFAEPDRFIGVDLVLGSDVKTLDECSEIYQRVVGRRPRRFPMPVWLLRRFAGDDLIRMFRWIHENPVHVDPAETLALLPQALSVEQWLRQSRTNATKEAA